jgi:carboxyl-terminal processing protease
VPPDGLIPDIFLSEVSYNLGTLGDINEPLLAAAIANITDTGRYSQLDTEGLEPLSVQKFLGPLDMEMYID